MKGQSETPEHSSPTAAPKKRSALVPLVLLLAGLGLAFMLYRHYDLYQRLQREGEKMQAEVTEVIPSEGYFGGYDVSLEYQVAEQFFYINQNMKESPSVGSQMTVLYLVDNPEQSMLNGVPLLGRKEMLIAGAATFLTLIGLILLIRRN